ncbi:MAG: DUF2092 domain-containing protein [Myxococcaceae bacterium]
MTASKVSARAALLFGLLLVVPSVRAQSERADAGLPPPGGTSDSAPFEPAAFDILRRMSAFLASSQTLAFAVRGYSEEPATTGQMVAFYRTSHVQLQRPDRVRIDVRGDVTNVSLWYDGKTVTLFNPLRKAFGSTVTPPTVDQTIDFLRDKYNAVFTISPFLTSDPFAVMSGGLLTAFVVGKAQVDGVACDQLAFTEREVDWQLWVQRGPRPLPRRVAVTYKTVPGAPRELLELSDWKLGESFPQKDFIFTPPPGSFRAEMMVQPSEAKGTP